MTANRKGPPGNLDKYVGSSSYVAAAPAPAGKAFQLAGLAPGPQVGAKKQQGTMHKAVASSTTSTRAVKEKSELRAVSTMGFEMSGVRNPDWYRKENRTSSTIQSEDSSSADTSTSSRISAAKRRQTDAGNDSGFVDMTSNTSSSSSFSKSKPPATAGSSAPLPITSSGQSSTVDLQEELRLKNEKRERFRAQYMQALDFGTDSAMGWTVDQCLEKIALATKEISILEAQLAASGSSSVSAGAASAQSRKTVSSLSTNTVVSNTTSSRSTTALNGTRKQQQRQDRVEAPPEEEVPEGLFDTSFHLSDIDDDEAAPVKQNNKRQPLRITTAQNSPKRPKVDQPPRTVQPAPRVTFSKPTTSKQPAPSKAAPTKAPIEYPWSKDVRKVLKQRFELRNFRKNQLEAINATLSGKDCFVLLPTGGGKSMCFQLPALVHSGTTRGVTVVLSPLISLIKDQVNNLAEKDICAMALNSSMTTLEKRDVYTGLLYRPEPALSMVYVTPELIAKGDGFRNALQELYKRKRLARFVIDEAHCLSQWGHDLRPDYVKLGSLRREFPGIPIMALTATANDRVKDDIIKTLNIKGCVMLNASFNRANLWYEVRTKKGNINKEIAEFIHNEHEGECGIIYCLSQRTCEQVADSLRNEYGVKAMHYHAAMDKTDRDNVQTGWQRGQYNVICATIAFGMGIDKADVRYVIHHSMPKTLEGYYQETGRAGRDGQPAVCILYYNPKDTATLRKMVRDPKVPREVQNHNDEMLNQVAAFCNNPLDCRRTLVLKYFQEDFAREQCQENCDNCHSKNYLKYPLQDVTQRAKRIVAMMQAAQTNPDIGDITAKQYADAYRGSQSRQIKDKGLDTLVGANEGSDLTLTGVERLFNLLSSEGITQEKTVAKGQYSFTYLILGRNAGLLNRGKRLEMAFVPPAPKVKGNSTAKAAPESKQPAVAAPRNLITHAFSKRKEQQEVQEEDEEEEEETIITTHQTQTVTRKRKSKAAQKTRRTKRRESYDGRDEDEYEPDDSPDEDDLHFVVDDDDTLTEVDSDDEEEEDSDVEVMNPEVWKNARQATQQPSKGASKRRTFDVENVDPAEALHAEIFQIVVDWLYEQDAEVNDELQNAIEQISLQCPTTAAGFTSIPGITDEIYDEIGSQLRKVTLKYAKRAGKLLASQAPGPKKAPALKAKVVKPASRNISIQSISSNSTGSTSSGKPTTSKPSTKKDAATSRSNKEGDIKAHLRNNFMHQESSRGSARGGQRLGGVPGGRSGISAMPVRRG